MSEDGLAVALHVLVEPDPPALANIISSVACGSEMDQAADRRRSLIWFSRRFICLFAHSGLGVAISRTGVERK